MGPDLDCVVVLANFTAYEDYKVVDALKCPHDLVCDALTPSYAQSCHVGEHAEGFLSVACTWSFFCDLLNCSKRS